MAENAGPSRTTNVFIASPGDRAVERRVFKPVLVLLWLAIAGVVLWAAWLFVVLPRYLRYAAIKELNQLGKLTITDDRVGVKAKLPDQKSFDRLGVLLRRVQWVQWTSLDLNLSMSDVSDLSPLVGLNGLTKLHLGNTRVSDLSPLSGQSGLTSLILGGTQVSDLSPLAGLTGLTELHLGNTRVSDLSPLSGQSGLTTLYLNGTRVSDLTPLAGLDGLTSLFLVGTPVSDLSPLAGVSGLTTLYLNGASVSDVSPLAGLSGLKRIVLFKDQDVKIPESLEKVIVRQ